MKKLTKKEQKVIDSWFDERFEGGDKSIDLYTARNGLDYIIKIKFIKCGGR